MLATYMGIHTGVWAMPWDQSRRSYNYRRSFRGYLNRSLAADRGRPVSRGVALSGDPAVESETQEEASEESDSKP